MPKSAEKSVKNAGFHSIGAAIHTRRESVCLPYEGYFILKAQHRARA